MRLSGSRDIWVKTGPGYWIWLWVIVKMNEQAQRAEWETYFLCFYNRSCLYKQKIYFQILFQLLHFLMWDDILANLCSTSYEDTFFTMEGGAEYCSLNWCLKQIFFRVTIIFYFYILHQIWSVLEFILYLFTVLPTLHGFWTCIIKSICHSSVSNLFPFQGY